MRFSTRVVPLIRARRDLSIDCKTFFCHIFGRSGDVSAAKSAFYHPSKCMFWRRSGRGCALGRRGAAPEKKMASRTRENTFLHPKTRFAAAKRPTSDRANPQQRAAGQSSRRHGPVMPQRPLHPGWAPTAGSGTCNARRCGHLEADVTREGRGRGRQRRLVGRVGRRRGRRRRLQRRHGRHGRGRRRRRHRGGGGEEGGG